MGEAVVDKKAVADRVDEHSRVFVIRAPVDSAFAAPVMASFRMDSLSVGSARAVTFGNQTGGRYGGFLGWLFRLFSRFFRCW